jgi:hypothetical protein
VKTSLKDRKNRFFSLSNQLAHVDNTQLKALLSHKGPMHGWGGTHVIKLGSSKVFVKKIPVTQLEYDNLFSTKNLFQMPTFYNYGVGSAGFGAFREIVAHIKTTNWVLDEAIENFPLMYHYRISPVSEARPEMNLENHKDYIWYWNSDENIDRYIRARHSAPFEAILFLEYIPHELGDWLIKNEDQWETVIREIRQTITFLRDRGVLHFDVHFWNVLTDDEIPYLTDFGLVLDKNFDLNPEEKEFFRWHIDYDYAEFLSCMGHHIHSIYRKLPIRARSKVLKQYGIEKDAGYAKVSAVLLENIEAIHAEGVMAFDDYYMEQVIKNRGMIQLMHAFYTRMQGNSKKNTPYPRTKIKRLLDETHFR